MQTGRTEQDREEEDWSIPTNVERRKMIQRGMSHQELLLLLLPLPQRIDYSQIGVVDSPREGTSQCNVSARNTESNINQMDNQGDQPRSESARNEAMGNTLSDVMTFPSACQEPSQVGTRLMDKETNTSEVEIRMQREEIRIDNLSSNNRDTQMQTSHSGLSSWNTE